MRRLPVLVQALKMVRGRRMMIVVGVTKKEKMPFLMILGARQSQKFQRGLIHGVLSLIHRVNQKEKLTMKAGTLLRTVHKMLAVVGMPRAKV